MASGSNSRPAKAIAPARAGSNLSPQAATVAEGASAGAGAGSTTGAGHVATGGELSLMAPLGHVSTQAPQSRQSAASITARPSNKLMAPAGQSATQSPQPVHLSLST